MNYTISILNILTGIFCFIVAYVHYKSKRRIGCFIFFIVSYGFYYGIIPAIFLVFIYSNNALYTGSYVYVNALVGRAPSLLFNSSLTCLLGAILLSVFYSLFYREKATDRVKVEIIDDRINKYGVVIFIIGFVSLSVIVGSLGGITEVFKYTEIIRAHGLTEVIDDSRVIILRPIAGFILLPPFLFFVIYSEKKDKLSLVFFIVSFIVASYYLVFNSGKTVMLLFYICFLIAYFLLKYKRVPIVRLVLVMIIAIMGLQLLDYIFYTLTFSAQPTMERNRTLALINNFMFPYTNLTLSVDMNDIYGFSYFSDYVNWISSIAPSSILKLIGIEEPIPAYQYTTRYYSSSTELLGGTPIDFLTFGMRQYGLLGLMVNSIIMSFIISKVDALLDRLDYRKFFIIILRVSLLFYLLIPYADPISNIRNRIDILLLIFVVILLLVKSKARGSEYETNDI